MKATITFTNGNGIIDFYNYDDSAIIKSMDFAIIEDDYKSGYADIVSDDIDDKLIAKLNIDDEAFYVMEEEAMDEAVSAEYERLSNLTTEQLTEEYNDYHDEDELDTDSDEIIDIRDYMINALMEVYYEYRDSYIINKYDVDKIIAGYYVDALNNGVNDLLLAEAVLTDATQGTPLHEMMEDVAKNYKTDLRGALEVILSERLGESFDIWAFEVQPKWERIDDDCGSYYQQVVVYGRRWDDWRDCWDKPECCLWGVTDFEAELWNNVDADAYFSNREGVKAKQLLVANLEG